MIAKGDIDHRFEYHPATTENTRKTHEAVREHCKDLAHFLNGKLPDGREKSLAMTALEEVMMWSNAAVARQVDLAA